MASIEERLKRMRNGAGAQKSSGTAVSSKTQKANTKDIQSRLNAMRNSPTPSAYAYSDRAGAIKWEPSSQEEKKQLDAARSEAVGRIVPGMMDVRNGGILPRETAKTQPVTIYAQAVSDEERMNSLRQRAASATEETDDEDEILRMAREDPAGLREKIAERVSMSSEAEDLYRKLYPNSGVIDTAKGMGEGLKIGVTKQFPASMAGLATGVHESVGTFLNMINTPVKDGKVEYEDYISPLRDDALRLKEAADAASLANLEGRGPASARLVGVSQAAGNMIPGAAVGGIGGALTGGALSGLSTALISAGAGGSSYLEAIQQGAGVGEAAAYGILSGATEYFTERLFGGNPLVDTRPGLVNQVVKKLGGSQKLLSFLASQPVETLNEGLEEAISEILNPVWQRLTYDPNADFATLEKIMDSAIDGVLLAGFMQGGSAVMERALRGKSKNTKPAEAQNAYRSATYVDANVNSRETASSPARSADARAYLNGDGPVTNSQAERIMDDASVMQELGIDTNGKTRSQIRKEVKAKVSEMRTQNTQSLTEQVAQKETELRTNVLESAKRTMGERGYATFEQAMRDDIDPAVYYRELTRAYNEGLAGVEGGSEVLTKVQYEEMWKAGRDDARASIEAQAQNASGRVSYKDAGIDYTDLETRKYVAASVDKQTAKAVDRVAKALGVKVRFADSVAGGNANAQLLSGVVTIEKGNREPVRFIFGHEITHRMQELAPQEYSRLREAVAAEMDAGGELGLDASLEKKLRLYLDSDVEIDREGALDEAVADYVGTMLDDQGELERFIAKHKDDRTLLEKLRDIVRDIARKLKGTDQDIQLNHVEKRLSETLDAAVKQAKKNAKAQKNTTQESGGEVKHSFKGYAPDGRGIYESNFQKGTPKSAKGQRILQYIQNVWSKNPISLVIHNADGSTRTIQAQFDPSYDEKGRKRSDATKLMGGNRHGTAGEQRVTLDLADDYYQIASEATYNYSKTEEGKDTETHEGVKEWHYFINDILFQEYGETKTTPYRVTINVKERSDGSFVYSFNAEKQNERPSTRRTLHADVTHTESGVGNAQPSEDTVAQKPDSVKHRSEVHNRVMNNQPVSADDEIKYSLKHDKQYMDLAIMSNDRRGFVSKRVMNEAAKARQAVADIFNDPDLADSLGLPPDVIGNTYIPNNSYSGTEENTTVCIRSIAADALMDAVAEHLGRPLTVEDTIAISQEYWKYTDKPECLYCYVAMDRKAHREFLGSYLDQRKAVLDNIHNGMSREEAYQKFLDGRKDTKPMRNRFDLWLKNDGKKLITPSDIASAANMENAIARDPSLKPQINDALKYAQSASWAKKRIGYAAYNNHILKWKQSRINSLNSNYGLRMYSFSDFSPAFILENMQMVTDAAVRGLKVLAYTKELDFVKIFAGTGMNINISVFGYNDGNGGVAMDAMQGADWAEAQTLREQYPNVGCTFVATNDAQVNWALDQDWIDVIIPFHMVRTGTKVANHFGWKNYTAISADTKNKAFDKAKNVPHILPPMHQNDKATYLKACEDNNLTPRFNDWVDHPNYMKLVNETRQSEANTKPVQPIFDVDAAKKSIDDMRKRGGYYKPIGGSEENMRYIAEGIAKGIQSEAVELSDRNVKYSLREKEPPKKTGTAYKVFWAKNGQLYPPMVPNPGGAGTPVGVWLDADIGEAAPPSKTGRPQVQAGGKGTNASKGSLAFRPGWHLGDLPKATQFARKNPETGEKDLFPADFVWAECEYAMDHDYQEEAMSYGYTENGKFRHSYAGLPRIPEDGYYRYRTNPNPDTVPWIITGAMRVKRILTDAETDKILRDAGVEPMKRQGGEINLEKLGLKAGDTTKFSLKDSDSLAREIARIQRDGAKKKRSEAEIQADVRAVVQEAYQAMIGEYGAIRTGEKPAREVQVPKRTAPNNRVSQTVRTVMEAGATPDEALPTIEEMTARGDFSYDVYGDEQAISDAREYIGDGWDEAQRKWFADVQKGVVNKRNTAVGWLLYDNAANNGNVQLAMDILNAMVEHQRNAAQAVQATRILKKLSPETQLYGVQRSVNRLQRELDENGRGRKKNAKAAVAVAEAATEARREAVTEIANVYKNGKVSRRGNRVVVEGNAAGEPFVFEYAQKVGEDIAKSMKAKLNSTKKERTFLQHISSQLKRFANEKLPPAEKGKSITAVEMLRDYIQNQAFYNEAWEAAQQELRDEYADDAMLSEFINSGIGVDANLNPRNAIFMRALVKSAAESRETKANIIRQSALGVTQISENIAARLIKETGAEGEMAQTIRDAAAGYVHDVLVEAETNAEKPLEADKLITSAIKGAMKDIGITLSDVVTSGTGAAAKQAIINKLITKYAFGFAEATNTAEIVERQFDSMSRKLAESKLESMFKNREHRRKTITEQMELLGNLGAFDMGSAYNSAAAERIFKQGVTLHINEDLAAQFLRAKTQEARDEILKDIYRDIGRQMPSTFVDKWNAWRYLAMLGNVRTHVRNVAGNAFFAPVVAAKDLTATAIESAVYRVSGGKTQRTKGKVTKALLSAAWADYSKVADTVAGGGKYSDLANANKYIEEGRRIFKLKPLEAARRGNSAALEAEDAWFSKPHYAFALAQYCQANGITEAQIRSGKGIEEARAYAAKEAQKATYRDTNQFSELVSNIRFRNPDTTAKKLANIAGEGILPFRKTPANILVRGLEYSPLGLMRGIKQAAWDVQNGNMSSAEAIDNIAAGLTGTGLLGLGVYLAAQGLIRGHGGDDDDKREFEEMMGHQAYSLELPNGTSVTLDWLAPEALPFFIGVNLWETTQGDDKDVTLASMLSAVSTVAEPLLEMSCLQSLNDAFEAVGYATSNDMSGIETVLSAAATSYLTQALPTILGQAERSAEGTRMTTYTEKNGFLTSDMQYTLGRASSRIPGLDYQQIPYIDAWGRVEDSGGAIERTLNNFLNPAYMSDIDTSETESALLALYDQTGDASILPSRAKKYFTVDGERKDLTAEEYVVYAQEKGQRSYQLVSDLMNSSQFNSMSDDEKVKAIRNAYDLANQKAKAAISDYSVDKWVDKAEEAQKKYGISEETYIGLKSRTASLDGIKDNDGETIPNSKSLKIMQEVYNTPGLTEKQRKALFEYLGVGKTVQHYNKAAVNAALAKMEKQAK